jgi:hypothetical protein
VDDSRAEGRFIQNRLKENGCVNLTTNETQQVRMKRCPQCNRVETDEGLVYCRVDGAALVSESSVADDANTKEFGSSAVSSEIATSILPHRTDAKIKHATAPTTVLSAQQPPATTQPLSKQSRRTFILASVTLGLAVIVVVGYFNF